MNGVAFSLINDHNLLARPDLPWCESSVRDGYNATGLLQGPYRARCMQIGPLRMEVRIHHNTQVQNELAFQLCNGALPSDTTGLLYRNFRPKLFRLNGLTNAKTLKRHLNCSRPYTNKIVHECTLEMPIRVTM